VWIPRNWVVDGGWRTLIGKGLQDKVLHCHTRYYSPNVNDTSSTTSATTPAPTSTPVPNLAGTSTTTKSVSADLVTQIQTAIESLPKLDNATKQRLKIDTESFLKSQTMQDYNWKGKTKTTRVALILNAVLSGSSYKAEFGATGTKSLKITNEELAKAVNCGDTALQSNNTIRDDLVSVFSNWKQNNISDT